MAIETIIAPRPERNSRYCHLAIVDMVRPSVLCDSIESGALTFAYTTHVGIRHIQRGAGNEDSVAVYLDGERLHAIVADGVSMGACGGVASAACANHLVNLRPEYPLESDSSTPLKTELQESISAANEAVSEAVAKFSQEDGATTFSGLWFSINGNGWVSRCGDCRIWLFWRDTADGHIKLHQLGEDQTFINTGDTPYSNAISPHNPSRMVGLGREYIGTPTVWDLTLDPGGGVLLTSDGIHGALSSNELQDALETSFARQTSLSETVVTIQEYALKNGSTDDVSVFLLYRPA